MLKRHKGRVGADGRRLPELQPTVIPRDPRRVALEEAADRNDVTAVASALYSATDHLELYGFLGVVLPGAPDHPAWLNAWIAEQPNDLVARTAVGYDLLRRGATVRTAHAAEHVSQEQFDAFHSIIRVAERVLVGVVQEHPAMAAAWAPLFSVGMGLQIPQEELHAYFARCNEHTPLFLPACENYLQSIAEKWGGTERGALEFARWASSQAPEGHYAHVLVAQAYLEMSMMHGDRVHTSEAITEMRQALERSRLAVPEWGTDRWGRRYRNAFACLAWRLGDDEVAAHMMRIIGLDDASFAKMPWGLFTGDSTDLYLKVGRRLGLW